MRSRPIPSPIEQIQARSPKDVLQDLRDLRDQVARLQQKIHDRRLDALIPWVDALRQQVDDRLSPRRKGGKMIMPLRRGDTARPRRPDSDMRPTTICEFTRLKRPTLVMLWKAQSARARHQARVNRGHPTMSNSDTRGSVIVGVCQQDPERWREFDSIYRPMLICVPAQAGPAASPMPVTSSRTSSSSCWARFRPTTASDASSGPGFSRSRTTRWSTVPGGGPAKGRPSTDGSRTCSAHPRPTA